MDNNIKYFVSYNMKSFDEEHLGNRYTIVDDLNHLNLILELLKLYGLSNQTNEYNLSHEEYVYKIYQIIKAYLDYGIELPEDQKNFKKHVDAILKEKTSIKEYSISTGSDIELQKIVYDGLEIIYSDDNIDDICYDFYEYYDLDIKYLIGDKEIPLPSLPDINDKYNIVNSCKKYINQVKVFQFENFKEFQREEQCLLK